MKRIGFIDSRRIKGFRFIATSGAGKGIDNEVIYDPVTSGHGTPIALAGKVTLAEGKEFSGGTGYMWGVQGQLNFEDGATLNEANSIFSAFRGVITASGTPVFTECEEICGLYIDNLCAIDMTTVATGNVSLAYLNVGSSPIHQIIHIMGSNSRCPMLFYIEGVPGFMSPGAAAGAAAKMAINWGGTTYYININQA